MLPNDILPKNSQNFHEYEKFVNATPLKLLELET